MGYKQTKQDELVIRAIAGIVVFGGALWFAIWIYNVTFHAVAHWIDSL